MSLFAVPVFAQYRTFDFNLDVDGYGNNLAWTEGNPKNDWEQIAYVNRTSTNLVESDRFYLTLVRASTFATCSEETRVYSYCPDNCDRIGYTDYADYNESIRLKAETKSLQVSFSGYWYS